MTKREIASLAFTLAGIYALTKMLWVIQWTFLILHGDPSLASPSRAAAWVGVAVLLSVSACTCAGLILGRQTLARWMFPEEQGNETPRVRLLAVQGVAFSVVGVFVFVSALPALLSYALILLRGLRPVSILDHVQQLAVPMGGTLLGAALFFGGQGVARFWSKLRSAGVRREMGLCVRCSYDLTGNVSGVCPECGMPIEASEG